MASTARNSRTTRAQKSAPAQKAPVAQKAPATPAAPAAPTNEAKVAAGYKARATYAESSVSGVTQVCTNQDACSEKGPQPIFHFPTTSRKKDGTLGRGKECRKCRDARRAAGK